MNSRLKDRAGFTLIELMLVVAIIGIISLIAVPTYMGFLAKARQSEAATNLGGIFVNEQAYFSEYDTYSDSFDVIGFGLGGASKYYDFTLTAPDGGTWPPNSWIGRDGGAGPPAGTVINFNAPPGVSTDPDGFTCIAVGNIDNDPAYDVWRIDQTSVLNNDWNDVIQAN